MKNRTIAFFAVLSTCIHLGLILTTTQRIPSKPPEAPWMDLTTLSDVELEAETKRDKRIVAETEESLDNTTPEVDWFHGKKTQSAQRQTQAEHTDRFQTGAKSQGHPQGAGAGRIDSLSAQDLGLGEILPRSPFAATDDRLEGVEKGSATILNTRENRYFSFYQRVKDRLRTEWKPEVEARAFLAASNGHLTPGKVLTTRVVVMLSPEGEVESISMWSSSGVTEVDEAATIAFERAARFPNVPKGMIDSDGFARLHWEFVLTGTGGKAMKIADGKTPDPTRRLD